MRNFETGVAPNSLCASACAMAWLGGTKRYMASQSRIGFHAAYVINNGVARETGLGNAIVGAYVTQLGLPLSAVIYITNSNPREMTWLSADDARKVGIDVEFLELRSTNNPASAAPEGVVADQSLHESYPLRNGEQWLIVASRSALSDALVIAKKYKSEFPDTMVLKAQNGRYAITIGRFIGDQETLTDLEKEGRVPNDSYFSNGSRLISVVWR